MNIKYKDFYSYALMMSKFPLFSTMILQRSHRYTSSLGYKNYSSLSIESNLHIAVFGLLGLSVLNLLSAAPFCILKMITMLMMTKGEKQY